MNHWVRRRSRLLAGCFLIISLLPGCFTSQERSGEALYTEHCANCHGADGAGLRGLIPPLDGVDYLASQRSALPCAIRYGLKGPMLINGRSYNGIMPAFSKDKLSDADVANILNYVRGAWSNSADDAITVLEVANINCR